MALRLRPVTLREAAAYVREHHRHNDAPRGHRVSVGVVDEHDVLRGVGILGRPLARGSDDGYTAEVLRVATDGAPHACSMLYGALVRASWALGYRKVITYTLGSEPGTSPRAAGFVREATLDGRTWGHTPKLLRHDQRLTMFYPHRQPPDGPRVRWAITRDR